MEFGTWNCQENNDESHHQCIDHIILLLLNRAGWHINTIWDSFNVEIFHRDLIQIDKIRYNTQWYNLHIL